MWAVFALDSETAICSSVRCVSVLSFPTVQHRRDVERQIRSTKDMKKLILGIATTAGLVVISAQPADAQIYGRYPQTYGYSYGYGYPSYGYSYGYPGYGYGPARRHARRVYRRAYRRGY